MLARQLMKMRTGRSHLAGKGRVLGVSLDGGCGGDCDCGAGRPKVFLSGQQKRFMGGAPFQGAKEDLTGTIPPEAEHATGLRREEYDDAVLGRERFNSSALYVDAKGTVEDPTLVPSMEADRVVGHMCDRFGANLITWCAVKQGEITVCPDCGHAFLLDSKLASEPLAAH
jgi:hypothetical protein